MVADEERARRIDPIAILQRIAEEETATVLRVSVRLEQLKQSIERDKSCIRKKRKEIREILKRYGRA
jgi:hypothetical protein